MSAAKTNWKKRCYLIIDTWSKYTFSSSLEHRLRFNHVQFYTYMYSFTRVHCMSIKVPFKGIWTFEVSSTNILKAQSSNEYILKGSKLMALELLRIQSWWDIINVLADIMTEKNNCIYQMKHDYVLASSSIRHILCFIKIDLCEKKYFLWIVLYEKKCFFRVVLCEAQLFVSWLRRQSPTSASFLFLSALLFSNRNIWNIWNIWTTLKHSLFSS